MAFFRWLNEVRKEFRTLMTGSLVLATMGLGQGLWAVPIPRWAYVAVSGAFLGWAFFLAWDKRDNALENAQAAIHDREEVIKGKAAEIASLKHEFLIAEQNYVNDISDLRRQLDDRATVESAAAKLQKRKAHINNSLNHAQALVNQAPRSGSTHQELQAWVKSVQAWADKVEKFFAQEGLAIARTKFNDLTGIRSMIFPELHSSIGTVYLRFQKTIQNLHEIVERPDAYLDS